MNKEMKMLNKVVRSIKHLSRGSTAFDSYFMSVQKPGGPTVDEAKRDFRAAIHPDTHIGLQ